MTSAMPLLIPASPLSLPGALRDANSIIPWPLRRRTTGRFEDEVSIMHFQAHVRLTLGRHSTLSTSLIHHPSSIFHTHTPISNLILVSHLDGQPYGILQQTDIGRWATIRSRWHDLHGGGGRTVETPPLLFLSVCQPRCYLSLSIHGHLGTSLYQRGCLCINILHKCSSKARLSRWGWPHRG
jgi:hypothetical protein